MKSESREADLNRSGCAVYMGMTALTLGIGYLFGVGWGWITAAVCCFFAAVLFANNADKS